MDKIIITTHSGIEDILEVENYDPEEVDRKRNDDSLLSVLIGGNSYSRIDIQNIRIVGNNEIDENKTK